MVERKDFKPQQNILMQKGKIWIPARVFHKHESPRSYMVEGQNGTIYRRNKLKESKSKGFVKSVFVNNNDDDSQQHKFTQSI